MVSIAWGVCAHQVNIASLYLSNLLFEYSDIHIVYKYEMKTVELPFNVETVDQYLYWHKKADQNQANTWMRNILLGRFG
jgi:hypothetical protein